MTKPGPAQRFPSNIIRINFPKVGGLVFFRVAMRWDGDVRPIAPKALVKGLPWGEFDLFEVVDGVDDPDGTPHESVTVDNPVTDKMLSKFRYWAHYRKASADHNSTLPSKDFYVLDLASYHSVYNHVIGSAGTPLLPSHEAAVEYFKGPGRMDGFLDDDLIGAALVNNTYHEISVNPPDDDFWGEVAQNGWQYHIEKLPPSTIYKRDEAAVVVFNLAKLFKDVPKDSSGKKPALVKFTVDLPVTPHFEIGHGSRLSWWFAASAWSPSTAKPQKDWQRRDFPVEDKQTPIRGIAGAFNYEYHVPTFPFHPQATVQDLDVSETARKAEVTITFGVGKVPPKVEIKLEDIVRRER